MQPADRLRRPGCLLGRWRAGLLALVVLVGALGLLTSACSTPSQVPWPTYDEGLQQRIDDAAAEHDCPTLRALHEYATATSQLHEKATGEPNDALVDYIEVAQEGAGCTS